MKIKIYEIILISFMLFGGCKKEVPPETLNNTPIQIPEYVLYGLYEVGVGDDSIIVIDAQKDSVIGRQQVLLGKESSGDFAIGPDGLLYIPISYKILMEELGTAIRIFNPSQGKIVEDVEVYKNPSYIFSLPNGEALIFHPFVAAGDSAFTLTVFDMNTKTVRKTLSIGALLNVDSLPGNQIYLFIEPLFTWHQYNEIVRFFPGPDSLSSQGIKFDTTFKALSMVSINKIYASRDNSIIVFDTLKNVIDSINVNGTAGGFEVLQNNKVYYMQMDKITVINTETDEVMKSVNIDSLSVGTHSKALNKLYISTGSGRTIIVLNIETDEITDTIFTGISGENPWGFSRLRVNK